MKIADGRAFQPNYLFREQKIRRSQNRLQKKPSVANILLPKMHLW